MGLYGAYCIANYKKWSESIFLKSVLNLDFDVTNIIITLPVAWSSAVHCIEL